MPKSKLYTGKLCDLILWRLKSVELFRRHTPDSACDCLLLIVFQSDLVQTSTCSISLKVEERKCAKQVYTVQTAGPKIHPAPFFFFFLLFKHVKMQQTEEVKTGSASGWRKGTDIARATDPNAPSAESGSGASQRNISVIRQCFGKQSSSLIHGGYIPRRNKWSNPQSEESNPLCIRFRYCW